MTMLMRCCAGILAVALAGGGAYAHEHEGHAPSTAKDKDEKAFTHQGLFTITGEVIDVACYTAEGKDATGAGHKACAVKCVKSGMPVGILQDNGTVVLAITAAHGPANELLLPHMATRVKAAGTMSQNGSLWLLAVKEVAPAGAAGKTAASKPAAAKETWECPMRCEGKTFDKAGKCPVCGMDLVKKKG